MSSTTDAKFGIEKSGSPERTSPNDSDESGGQEGGKEEVNLPPWAQRFGRKEEKKEGRIK